MEKHFGDRYHQIITDDEQSFQTAVSEVQKALLFFYPSFQLEALEYTYWTHTLVLNDFSLKSIADYYIKNPNFGVIKSGFNMFQIAVSGDFNSNSRRTHSEALSVAIQVTFGLFLMVARNHGKLMGFNLSEKILSIDPNAELLILFLEQGLKNRSIENCLIDYFNNIVLLGASIQINIPQHMFREELRELFIELRSWLEESPHHDELSVINSSHENKVYCVGNQWVVSINKVMPERWKHSPQDIPISFLQQNIFSQIERSNVNNLQNRGYFRLPTLPLNIRMFDNDHLAGNFPLSPPEMVIPMIFSNKNIDSTGDLPNYTPLFNGDTLKPVSMPASCTFVNFQKNTSLQNKFLQWRTPYKAKLTQFLVSQPEYLENYIFNTLKHSFEFDFRGIKDHQNRISSLKKWLENESFDGKYKVANLIKMYEDLEPLTANLLDNVSINDGKPNWIICDCFQNQISSQYWLNMLRSSESLRYLEIILEMRNEINIFQTSVKSFVSENQNSSDPEMLELIDLANTVLSLMDKFHVQFMVPMDDDSIMIINDTIIPKLSHLQLKQRSDPKLDKFYDDLENLAFSLFLLTTSEKYQENFQAQSPHEIQSIPIPAQEFSFPKWLLTDTDILPEDPLINFKDLPKGYSIFSSHFQTKDNKKLYSHSIAKSRMEGNGDYVSVVGFPLRPTDQAHVEHSLRQFLIDMERDTLARSQFGYSGAGSIAWGMTISVAVVYGNQISFIHLGDTSLTIILENKYSPGDHFSVQITPEHYAGYTEGQKLLLLNNLNGECQLRNAKYGANTECLQYDKHDSYLSGLVDIATIDMKEICRRLGKDLGFHNFSVLGTSDGVILNNNYIVKYKVRETDDYFRFLEICDIQTEIFQFLNNKSLGCLDNLIEIYSRQNNSICFPQWLNEHSSIDDDKSTFLISGGGKYIHWGIIIDSHTYGINPKQEIYHRNNLSACMSSVASIEYHMNQINNHKGFFHRDSMQNGPYF